MSKSQFTLTTAAPGPIKIANPNGLRKTSWLATIFTNGTFGAGTVNYFLSPDGGTTQVPLKNAAGTAYTATAADYISTGSLGGSNNNSGDFSIFASLTSSTAATVTITVYDNI